MNSSNRQNSHSETRLTASETITRIRLKLCKTELDELNRDFGSISGEIDEGLADNHPEYTLELKDALMATGEFPEGRLIPNIRPSILAEIFNLNVDREYYDETRGKSLPFTLRALSYYS